MATVTEMMMQDAAASVETSYTMNVGDMFKGSPLTMMPATQKTGSRLNWKRGTDLFNQPYRPSYGSRGGRPHSDAAMIQRAA